MAWTVAVAGKGGTGKTTIAALIVDCLRGAGKGPVLAIDADPDANLGTLLGIHPEETVGDLLEEILRQMKKFPAGMTKAAYVEAGLHRVIEESEGVDLITMGRGEGPGCYCSLNNLIRKFSDDLTPSYGWVVMDNEAGLEHISRRTTSRVDALVIVVNRSPVSLHTADKIIEIAKSLKNEIGHTYVIANMVDSGREEELRKRLEGLDAEYLGSVPVDTVMEEAVFDGQTLRNLHGSVAKDRIYTMLESMGGRDDGGT